MSEHALPHPLQVVVGVGAAQHLGLLDGQPRRDVAVERIVRAGLIGDDVDLHAAAHELGQDLGGVGRQADREATPVGAGAVQPGQRVVEVGRALVQVAGLDPSLDPVQVDLDAQRGAVEHRDRQRLGAAHPAEPGGDDQPAGERAAEALARGGGERLIGALEDALAADVDPRAGGHLAVHHQPGGIELAKRLPRRPLRDQVGVGDQHPRRLIVGLEHRHRLARLDDQRLGVPEPAQLPLDRVKRRPVARRLADPAVDDELVGLLGDVGMQVVVQHPQRRLLLPTPTTHPRAHRAGTLPQTPTGRMHQRR